VGGACSAYGEGRGVYRVLVEKPEGKRLFLDLGVDGRIIKAILRTLGVWVWTGLSFLSIGTGGGHL
jgi:hypothetical protein